MDADFPSQRCALFHRIQMGAAAGEGFEILFGFPSRYREMKVSGSGVFHFDETLLGFCLPRNLQTIPGQPEKSEERAELEGSDGNKHLAILVNEVFRQ